MTETTDRIANADRAEAALQQFLRPAFETARQEYAHSLAIIGAKPMSIETMAGITNLSIALKVLNELQQQIEMIVIDGKVAHADMDRAQRMSTLTTEAQRWAKY